MRLKLWKLYVWCYMYGNTQESVIVTCYIYIYINFYKLPTFVLSWHPAHLPLPFFFCNFFVFCCCCFRFWGLDQHISSTVMHCTVYIWKCNLYKSVCVTKMIDKVRLKYKWQIGGSEKMTGNLETLTVMLTFLVCMGVKMTGNLETLAVMLTFWVCMGVPERACICAGVQGDSFML